MKKVVALFLSLVMVLSLCPITALAEDTHSHPVCGAEHSNIGDHTGTCEEVEWQPLSSILGEPDSSGRYEGTTIAQAGNYYLDKDIPLYDGLIIAADVSLCLNGYTLTYRDTYEGVTVENGATLNICDCSEDESGMINTYEFQANTVALRHGTVNLYSGTLKSEGSIALRGYVEGGNYTVNQYGGTAWGDGTEVAVSIEGEDGASAAYNLYGGMVKTRSTNADTTISIMDNAELFISGAPEISNASSWEYASDIYTETPIHIAGALTADAPQYSVLYSQGGGDIYTGTFTSGWKDYMSSADFSDYFTSADSAYIVQKDGSGELELAEPSATNSHSHDMSVECGGSGVTFEPWDGTTAFPGGNVYLTADVTLSSTLTISGTVNLCLNGHVLSGSDKRISTVTVQKNAVLNLCDCGTEASHKIIKGEQQWFLTDEGTDTIYGGVIVGGRGTMSDERAGGICINGGTLNMYAGSIIGGYVGNFGGGVFVTNSGDTNGSFTMYDGTIAGNYAYSYGAGVYVENGTFHLIDGNITGNYAGLGGGVYVISSSSVFNMSGGSIDSNKANNNGSAGVTVLDGLYNLSGGKVINNEHLWEAAGWGGIYIKGEFKLSGAPEISGNTSTCYETGGNIFLCDDRVITIEDELSNATPIGVVIENKTGVFTDGGENYQAKFYSEEGYSVVPDGAGNLMLAEHVHDYTYAVNTENAAQVIESCTCGHKETATLEIDTTVSTVYTGSAITPLKVTYSNGWEGTQNTEISYSNNINAGEASGSVTIGGATVSKSFAITKKSAEASEYTTPTDLTATYGQTLADISLPTGWAWKDSYASVGEVGTNTFVAVFTPSDSNYAPVEVNVTVNVSAPAPTTYTVTFNANGGSGTMNPVTAEEDVEFIYPSCEFTAPAGKQFKGWSPDAGSTEVITAGTQTFWNGGDNIALYAIWDDVSGNVSSLVEIEQGNTNHTMMDCSKMSVVGLEEIEKGIDPGKHITIKLSVTPLDDVSDNGAVVNEEIKLEQKAIKQVAAGKKVEFLDLTLTKTVTTIGSTETTKTDIGGDNEKLLTITVPFNTEKAKDIAVYRYHGCNVDSLSENPANGDEGFTVGDGMVTIFAYHFSTYAIGYVEKAASTPSYNYPIYDPVVDDAVTKVDPPKTFDGITLAVGLSILSATGSAWLLRKKED